MRSPRRIALYAAAAALLAAMIDLPAASAVGAAPADRAAPPGTSAALLLAVGCAP